VYDDEYIVLADDSSNMFLGKILKRILSYHAMSFNSFFSCILF
jgi:hypothetical protein